MAHRSTYGLTSRQLGRLLAIGREPRDEGEKAEAAGIAAALREMLADAELGAPLCAPSPPLAALERAKNHWKELAEGGEDAAQRAAATALYYAAIAQALVGCGERITHLPAERQARGFARLEAKPWVPAELRDLFRRARAAVAVAPRFR
ncbi:MAG: hypothetical protein FJ290_15645 [Planctomycetes bacterium]|nr:hypothetical protein [Planctomycetota bacterium]